MNKDDDDNLDPRIQIELERLNNATDEINKLEMEMDVTYEVAGDEGTDCNSLSSSANRLFGQASKEAARADALFSKTVSVNGFTPSRTTRCIKQSIYKYTEAIRLERDRDCRHTTNMVDDKECVRLISQTVDCLEEQAKNFANVVNTRLDDVSECSRCLGDSKIANHILAQVRSRLKAITEQMTMRSALEFNPKIIDELKALKRKIKDETEEPIAPK